MIDRTFRLCAAGLFVSTFFLAQAQLITTVAGTDFAFPATPIAATNAPTGTIGNVAVDSSGNLYFTEPDIGNNLVFKVDRQGTLTIVAGNGTIGFSGDGGPATSAALDSPVGVAVDPDGNVFIADTFNHRIRRVTPNGIITTVAGNGTPGYSGDGGLGTNAELNMGGNAALATDGVGDLYIADQNNNVIRGLTPSGIIFTAAGNGATGYSGDGGLSTNASLNLNGYGALAIDASGNLYIADEGNSVIRKVTPDGIISTVAGTGTSGFSGDGGPPVNAMLNKPDGVAADASGNLYVADNFNARIRKITAQGTINTIAGTGSLAFSGDGGPAVSAALNLITGVAVDTFGNVFIADSINERIRKVNPAGIISSFVGNGRFRFVGDSGPATSAAMNYPSSVAADTSGNLFITDPFNARIRKVTPAGIMSTVAGNGSTGFFGDGGPATQAGLFFPFGVAVDGSGNLFIADTDNVRIRKVTPQGIISTVAGNGIYGFSGDGGEATSASFNLPTSLAVDASGNLFVADHNNNRIRKVTPGGTISTVVGKGTAGFSGDGGPALSAELNLPTSVAVHSSGALFIVDSGNDRVRKVTPGGVISTVAGNGTVGYSNDGGPAIGAALNLNPNALYDGIAVDAAANIFFPDYFTNRIRKVTTDGVLTTVAGDGIHGFFGDGGPATDAGLSYPSSVALDTAGNLYITDTFNKRVRAVLAAVPGVTVSPQQLAFTASSGGAPTPAQTVSLTSPVDGLSFSLSGGASWLQLNPTSGASPRLMQMTTDPTGLDPATYHAIITVNTPNGNPASTALAVTFNVTAALPPALSIDKPGLSFPFPLHGSALSQTLTVSNTGGGTLQFTATAATTSGGGWLSVAPASGQALPGKPATLTAIANPSGLSAGVYSGQLTVTAGTQNKIIAVTMTVSTLDQAILLSQSGLSFLAVNGGGVIPTQSFGVQNIGTGPVNWTASTSTLAGGPDWLQVSPASGSSDAASATSPRVTVSVNGAGLPAGTYYGLVRVDAPGAANSPQVLTVFLQVLPANTNVAGVVQPAQLLFTATAGGESPSSQLVQVYNIVSGAKSFRSLVSTDPGLGLITLPIDRTLDPEHPTSIVVQPVTAGLRAGVYTGVLTLQFSDGNISTVKLTVIVSNPGRGRSSSLGEAGSDRLFDSAAPCTVTKLFPALTTLGPTFSVSAGWPTALVVDVKDDCGNPMPANGSVTVNFSDGESSLALEAQGGGSWESTWPTGSASSSGITLRIHAAMQGVTGDTQVTGNLGSQQEPPVFGKAGITSGAVVAAFTPLAPGSVISIYGSRLAESTAQAQTIPLPQQLVSTQVLVAGINSSGSSTGLVSLPLYYVSENQINALIPFGVAVDTTLQLLVQRGSTYSVPVQIDMAKAQPAVFSSGGLSGSPGLIYAFPAKGGAAYLVSASAPAHVGDTIVLYCAGLGAVDPPIPSGAAPGKDLSSTVTKPQVTIGGQSAEVSFAGLAPNFAGLYQVNAVIPSGVQTGANVPLTMNIDGQASPPITLAIQ